MSKRKKNNGKSWFSFFKRDGKKKTASLTPRSRKKKDAPRIPSWLWVMLTIIGFALLAAGLTAGFMYMESYVKKLPQTQQRSGSLKLVNPPVWLEQAWLDAIIKTAGGSRFVLDEDAARVITERLGRIPWMTDVRVQTMPDNIVIHAGYRRPIVRIAAGKDKYYYLDEQMVLFDALPVTQIAIPEVVGFTQRSIPSPGSVWLADDVKAAVELVYVLSLMDLQMMGIEKPIQKPLLDEIASIDVTNYAGRKSAGDPHLVLDVKDGQTKVFWGAAMGQASRHLEANEKEKVTNLYQHYTEYGNTLQGKGKFIELRQPQTLIPRPQ